MTGLRHHLSRLTFPDAPPPVGVRRLSADEAAPCTIVGAWNPKAVPGRLPHPPARDCRGGVSPPKVSYLSGEVPIYYGVSYCDAVRRAEEGETLRVLPGSLQVCQWSPVILGLKEPGSPFERSLAPRLDFPLAGLLLAPLDRFPGEPELVIVRAGQEALHSLIARLGSAQLWTGHADQPDRSAVPLFTGRRAVRRQGLIRAVNRMLAGPAHSSAWQTLTQWLFRSKAITAGFETLISHTLADMSVCRNSTVIPLLTGQVNASFFCVGGITWGRNRPDHLTSGWPWDVIREA